MIDMTLGQVFNQIFSHPFIFIALIAALILVLAFSVQFDLWRMEKAVEKAKDSPDKKYITLINPEFHDRYAFAVKAAANHFPNLQVWGEHIQNGTGYAVFFTDGKIKSAWQVRATICVNEKNHQIDLLSSGDLDAEIKIALEAVQKSMNPFARANGTHG